ncbi:hypothetical protein SCLCIDRAFT_24223 [Scleroderma citrinum Foug A]|uniref:Uncharacterized protein n=1 Tax=Scleroderma citrinum Foug A TaxID=1036808 RepID=A0A0C3DSE8_9AGAM|nr:hypothetical protein SCLCIDRAFT_24223 [Scleroderma citrinum Foug A]
MHVIPFSDPSRLLRTGALPTSVSMDDDGTIADDEMQQELGQGEGEDYDGCEDEPTDAANQWSCSTLPPPVQQRYEEHLSMLKAFKKTSTPQNYYDLHGTFWLPRRSSYFVIHSKTTPRPANWMVFIAHCVPPNSRGWVILVLVVWWTLRSAST